ncbi:histone acetyltransferase KAT6A-like [Neocloeon triangulifer]|uniref:histone acetyltransferase KAT6A-like n=1 Tax=Neocloeon triangulifer TaxID=2078957 RepID=UPI00286F8D6F|nr:histone acetyltransferase KAT6A-like [Neocloeon triangulifer]
MRGSNCLVLILALSAAGVAGVPPNHAPNHRVTPSPKFRPSPRYEPYEPQMSRYEPPRPRYEPPPFTTPSPPPPTEQTTIERVSAAVSTLRRLVDVDRTAAATTLHEEKAEAASGHLPLVHALPQLMLLLQLLMHLLHQVVPVPPHLHPYHHSGAHLYPKHHHHGGLLHHKAVGGPFYGPGLYGVSATNNVLGRGPFPAYKVEDNAKK